MAEFPALPLWTDAYLGDTTHLTTFEHGAYLLLLIISWRTPGCALPDDDEMLARFARTTKDKWRKLRPVLEPFFRIRNGKWHQARLQDEFQHLQSRRTQQVEAGNASAKAKALKRQNRGSTDVSDLFQRNANETPTPTPTPTPTTIDKSIVSNIKRGSRLPEAFEMPQPWIEWAMGERHWSRDDAQTEAANFIDFWHSKSGKDATKLDWKATWRNWVRNSRRVGLVSAKEPFQI